MNTVESVILSILATLTLKLGSHLKNPYFVIPKIFYAQGNVRILEK